MRALDLKVLRRDQRGGILILAIPMTALAIGCLWYLASARDAIEQRKQLQDIADELAWQSANLHARGMNAAVLSNLAISTLSVVPATLDSLGTSAATQPPREHEFMPRIDRALALVVETQRAVAAATPVLAASLTAADIPSTAANVDEPAPAAGALSYAALSPNDCSVLRADTARPWVFTTSTQIEETAPSNSAMLPLVAASGSGMKLAPGVRNGNALLQVWSFASSVRSPRVSVDERGLSVAFGRSVTLHPSTNAVAQAEYYFDCDGDWDSCAASAAFEPRWTARLRRYERPDGADRVRRDPEVETAFTRAWTALPARRVMPEPSGDTELVGLLFADPASGTGRYIH